jgi:hypothetical protein
MSKPRIPARNVYSFQCALLANRADDFGRNVEEKDGANERQGKDEDDKRISRERCEYRDMQ